MKYVPFLIALLLIAITACRQQEQPTTGDTTGDSTESALSSVPGTSSVRETQNVSYQGKVETAGPSIMMQGTHQLRLSDGRLILLESQDIDLNRYIAKHIGVFGAVRPTVEGNGVIMRVEEVILLEESALSTEASSASTSLLEPATVASSSAPPVPAVPSSSPAPLPAAASSIVPIISPSPPPPPARSAVPAPVQSSTAQRVTMIQQNDTVPEEISARAHLMARDKMDDPYWTQQYCSSHIGFCIPIHKNWWFKSFGTTTSSLWHVEVNNAEIRNLGEGPVVVKLLSGNVSAKKATDGQVRVQGNWIMGFRSWGANEHFEVMAPTGLQKAVEYITEHLAPQQ